MTFERPVAVHSLPSNCLVIGMLKHVPGHVKPFGAKSKAVIMLLYQKGGLMAASQMSSG